MKPTRLLSLLLAAILLLLPLSACSRSNPAGDDVRGPTFDELNPTDTLVIYVPADLERLLKRTIDQYTSRYGVKVEIVVVYGDYARYNERVASELAGGEGPDVLFLDLLYQMDVEKTALNRNFLDLTDVMATDPDFSPDAYIDGIFELGRIGGRQYTVPISYYPTILVSVPSKLEELGFRWKGIHTAGDFMEEAARVTPIAKDLYGFAFSQVMESKNYFGTFLQSAGIRLLDYEKGTVLPDEKALRDFLRAYKVFFPHDYKEGDGTYAYGDGSGYLRSNVFCFWCALGVSGLKNTLNDMKENTCAYRIDAVPSQKGDVVAVIYKEVAIRVNTENTLNAYNFIKMLLSEEIQKDQFTVSPLPVNKEALRAQIDHSYTLDFAGGGGGRMVETDDLYPSLSEKEREEIYEKLTGIDRYLRYSSVEQEMLWDAMLPFFQDEKSYDDCLKELKNKLTFYLSE